MPENLSPKALKAIATTRLRAKTLFQDGYQIDPDPSRPGVYVVTTPERAAPKTGEIFVNRYTVDLPHGECDCPAFEQHRECKHLHATVAAVAAALRLVQPLAPEAARRATGFASTEDFHRARRADFD